MLNQSTIADLSARLRKREISSRELTQACIHRVQQHNPSLNAFISLDETDALKQADAADARLAQKDSTSPPLLGIPVAIKDLIAVQGQPLNCGSKILNNFISPYNATAIGKLQENGAILFGRLNMDEFAMGSSNENSAFGPTRNPWNLEHVPGGSSGGSAVAVATDLCVAALGSDTGGSIRQPAAFCSCVGLKPTYGRVSRYGLVAFASSLDQIGPVTKTVADAAALLNAVSGHDPCGSTSLPEAVPNYSAALGRNLKGLKLGLPKEYFVEGIDPQVNHAAQTATQHLQSLGAEVLEVSLPHTELAVATYYIIATAEASANLARFDGIRYGLRVEGEDLLSLYTKTRGAGFGPEVKRRILLGTYVLSSGYYDAYYLRAQKVRTLIRQDFLKAFEQVDALVTPTTPTPAFKAGEKVSDPLQMYLSDIFTLSCNLSGVCGLSLPCGFTSNPRLPIGLQLLGKPFGEETLLQIGHAYETSTEWHRAKPTLT